MSLSKIALGISIICGAALTVFIWMPLFALGGLVGAFSSFLSNGFRWYGSLYEDRNGTYKSTPDIHVKPFERSEYPRKIGRNGNRKTSHLGAAVIKMPDTVGELNWVSEDPDEQYLGMKFLR